MNGQLRGYTEAVWLHGQTGQDLADCTLAPGLCWVEGPGSINPVTGEESVTVIVDAHRYRIAATAVAA